MAKDKKVERTEIKEFGRVALLSHLFSGSEYKNSDITQIAADDEDTATINKLLLEGIDFDLTYTPMKYLGYRAVTNSIGDLYAHFFTPTTLNFTIAVSAKFSIEHLRTLWEGVLTACKVYHIKNLSLDITSSLTGLSISCSASGKRKKEISKEISTPKNGDLICVSGDLGAAYMGLHVLMREKVAFNESKEYKQPDLSQYKYLLSRYLSPEVDSEQFEKLLEHKIIPSDGRFIMRGLGDAVKSLCSEYNLGAKIYIEKIPIASQTSEMAKEISIDIITSVVNGGDDSRLLYIIPLQKHEELMKKCPSLEVIGHFTSDNSAVLISPQGESFKIKAQGWGEE